MSNFHDCPDCGNYHEVGERVMNPDWKPAPPAMREALDAAQEYMEAMEAHFPAAEKGSEAQKAWAVRQSTGRLRLQIALRAALSAPQEAGDRRFTKEWCDEAEAKMVEYGTFVSQVHDLHARARVALRGADNWMTFLCGNDVPKDEAGKGPYADAIQKVRDLMPLFPESLSEITAAPLVAPTPPLPTLTPYLNGKPVSVEIALEVMRKMQAPLTDAEVVDSAPQEFKDLGARLGDLLDDDQWNNVEPLLLKCTRLALRSGSTATGAHPLEWQELFNRVARALKCLPSAIIDGNEHVFKKIAEVTGTATGAGEAWTSEKPVKTGFYWWRPDMDSGPEPMRIFRDGATNIRAEWCGSGIDHDLPRGLYMRLSAPPSPSGATEPKGKA